MKKLLKIILYCGVLGFAGIGFFLTAAFFAIRLHLTDDPGAVDYNDRTFQRLAASAPVGRSAVDESTLQGIQALSQLYGRIVDLHARHPVNAALILNAFQRHRSVSLAERMLEAVALREADPTPPAPHLLPGQASAAPFPQPSGAGSIFEWMNIPEWTVLGEALANDRETLARVAEVSGVEARLVAAVTIGEQIRLFNSKREVYKRAIAPLRILSVETKISWGVTGIKDFTAMAIERNLKRPDLPFYLGPEYETLLDFATEDVAQERFRRLTSYKDHYYSYLYAALFMKQVQQQWQQAGFDLSGRPEILATLYNLGFPASKPKENPSCGGSRIEVNGRWYTFGSLAYEFYYSGELLDAFPFEAAIFDWKKLEAEAAGSRVAEAPAAPGASGSTVVAPRPKPRPAAEQLLSGTTAGGGTDLASAEASPKPAADASAKTGEGKKLEPPPSAALKHGQGPQHARDGSQVGAEKQAWQGTDAVVSPPKVPADPSALAHPETTTEIGTQAEKAGAADPRVPNRAHSVPQKHEKSGAAEKKSTPNTVTGSSNGVEKKPVAKAKRSVEQKSTENTKGESTQKKESSVGE